MIFEESQPGHRRKQPMPLLKSIVYPKAIGLVSSSKLSDLSMGVLHVGSKGALGEMDLPANFQMILQDLRKT